MPRAKQGIFITFVDLTKAFDTVNKKGLWTIPERLGCSPQFLAMVSQLREDQLGQVRHSSILSRPFNITNGMKQGCVLAPMLFTLFFGMMLQQVREYLNDKDGVYISICTDSSRFNINPHKGDTYEGAIVR